MKKMYVWATILMVALSFSQAMAQMTPQPSPKASVSQVVGLTDIKIDYFSPAVKGRQIWGSVVPYNEVWRAGANSPTKVTFSDEVSIEGSKVPAGSYTLMVLPKSASEWIFIVSKDPKNAGAFGYDQKDDVVRITVTPENGSESKERLAYYIEPVDNNTGKITLHWEKAKASFTVKVDPDAKAMANIKKDVSDRIMASDWYALAAAAEYYVDNNKSLEEAQKWVDASMALREHFFNRWIKAKLAAKQNNYADAVKYIKEAQTITAKDEQDNNFYDALKSDIEKKLTEWSAMVPAAAGKKKGK